jgi:hypothetical protein
MYRKEYRTNNISGHCSKENLQRVHRGRKSKEDIQRLWNQKSKWYYVLMYKNGKMRPLETILRMGGRRIKENGGGGEFS